MIPVLVMTSDKYIDALKPFFFLYNKYWRPVSIYVRPKVYVGGFTKPPFFDSLSDKAEFISIGKFEDFPINKWSDGLIIALNKVEANHVILMLEDYWITHPVNLVAIDHAVKYCTSHNNVIKFDLMGDRRYAKDADLRFGKYGILELIKSNPGSPYHLSLMTGVWHRELLLNILQQNWSPWDIEIDGTRVLSQFPELLVIGSHQWPLQHTLGFRGGDIGKIFLNELKVQDVASMREAGMLKPWEG